MKWEESRRPESLEVARLQMPIRPVCLILELMGSSPRLLKRWERDPRQGGQTEVYFRSEGRRPNTKVLVLGVERRDRRCILKTEKSSFSKRLYMWSKCKWAVKGQHQGY